MFAIAFILYRITTCFKRIMTNAGAKLQNKYEIFLRSTEKFSFLTIIFSYTSFSPQSNRNRPCWCRFLGFSSLEFPFLFRLDLLAGTAVELSSVILLLFSCSSHVRPFPVILSEVCSSLLPWRLWLMSSISSILNVLLRESAWLAETSCIASFTCEPCAIVLCRPPSYLPFSGEASHTYFFRRKVSASRILQVPGSLFPEFFQKLFAVCRASKKNCSWPRGEIIR